MIVDELAEGAAADLDTLRALIAKGEVPETTRAVDFFIECDTAQIAEDLSAFLASSRFATMETVVTDDGICVRATLEMPLLPGNLLAVSGFFLCVSRLFRANYTGWGTIVQKVDTHPA